MRRLLNGQKPVRQQPLRVGYTPLNVSGLRKCSVPRLRRREEKNIHKIAAIEDPLDPERILTVAAYCRVSTDDLNQVMSIELQKDEYKKKICGNPKWKYYGTFVDDGYSGTNTDHRKAFQLMIDHAMAGKFDMVITKSVSRFARNLMDCVKYVNLLRKHDPPHCCLFRGRRSEQPVPQHGSCPGRSGDRRGRRIPYEERGHVALP